MAFVAHRRCCKWSGTFRSWSSQWLSNHYSNSRRPLLKWTAQPWAAIGSSSEAMRRAKPLLGCHSPTLKMFYFGRVVLFLVKLLETSEMALKLQHDIRCSKMGLSEHIGRAICSQELQRRWNETLKRPISQGRPSDNSAFLVFKLCSFLCRLDCRIYCGVHELGKQL